MKYIIKVYYNDLGKRLTKQDEYIIKGESKYALTSQEVQEIVSKNVPDAMVHGFEQIDSSYFDLEVGMYVKVREDKYDYRGEFREGAITTNKIIEVNDKYIRVEGIPYNFKRTDGTGKNTKALKSYISIMDNAEYNNMIRNLKREHLWKCLAHFICPDCNDYDIIPVPYVEDDIIENFMDEIGCEYEELEIK